MRENGFDYPLHPLQCLTWALFPVILLDFYWLLLPLLPGEATRWAVGTAYTAAAATTFFCAWITAAVDPRDPSVAAAAPPATNRLARCCEPLALWPPPVGEDTCRCYLCQVHVFASSKHCRFCDKCVLRFDHHCKWLNTRASARPGAFVYSSRGRAGGEWGRPDDARAIRCVGAKNYGYFLAVIASTCVFTTMQLALSVYVVVELAVPDRRRSAVAARARRHAVGRERGVDAVLALVCAYAALLVPLVVLIGQLALFHAMLVRRGLTTYEYILGEQRIDERPSAPPRTICEPCAPPIPPATPEDSPDLVVVERGRGDGSPRRAGPAGGSPAPTSGDIGAAGGVSSTSTI